MLGRWSGVLGRRSIHSSLKLQVVPKPMGSSIPSSHQAAPRRVVSLLPSATEHFAALVSAAARLGHTTLPELVGRSHECDFPPSYASIPVLTKPRTTFTSCEDTHNQVLNLLQSDDSLYEIDADLLTQLAPDLILVQDVCNVCSIDRPSVSCAMASNATTEILLINSRTLTNALEDSVRLLGKALHLDDAAEAVVAFNRARQTSLTKAPSSARRPIVYIIEWMEPLFLAKGWADEMVALVGGKSPVSTGRIADPSVLEPPDLIVVALCGLDRATSAKELRSKPFPSWWRASPAVKAGHVYVVDGNQMFNRPTNRLLDAMEWLGVVVANPAAYDSIEGFPVEAFDSLDAGAPPEMSAIEAAIFAAHAAACAANEARYNDPATGYGVFTAKYLMDRQACCGNRCRHCPYGHANVPLEQLHLIKTKNTLTSSVFLRAPKPSATGCLGYRNPKPVHGELRDAVVVFWSGGKDSLLALVDTIEALNSAREDIVLLTTFNPNEEVVPVQNIDTRTVVAQANAMNLPLFLVAIPTGSNYKELVDDALREIPRVRMPHIRQIKALVVGDLHLQDVHDWRVAAFPEYEIRSPLWRRDMHSDLLPRLGTLCDKYNATVRYSAVDRDRMPPSIQEGDTYDPTLVPATVDVMGENGEFHTVVHFG